MLYLRAFISGLVIPSVLLPIALLTSVYFGKSSVLSIPFLHILPLVWGVWNVIYFAVLKSLLPASAFASFFISGAILGLLVAGYGIHWLHLPALLGIPEEYQFAPLIGAPLIYGFLFALFVKPLCEIVGIKERSSCCH